MNSVDVIGKPSNLTMDIYHLNPASTHVHLSALNATTIFTTIGWSDEFNDPGYTLRYGLLGSVVLR